MSLTAAQIVITFYKDDTPLRSVMNYDSVIAAQSDFELFTKFGNSQDGKFKWQLMLMNDNEGNFAEEKQLFTNE